MDTRQRLVEAAIEEFATHGFDGASTRRIADAASSHQPQINYFFGSKEDLWREAVSQLFDELGRDTRLIATSDAPERVLCTILSTFVRFAHRRPALHRIMFHEFSSNSARLGWIVERYTSSNFADFQALWAAARNAGIAADIDHRVAFHTFVGAATLLPVARSELSAQLAAHGEADIDDKELVDAHARALQVLLLPNLDTSRSV